LSYSTTGGNTEHGVPLDKIDKRPARGDCSSTFVRG